MPVQIDEIKTEVDVRPDHHDGSPRGAASTSRTKGSEPMSVDKFRTLVLEIIREELERMRRQQG
jgi:hypothetical protein